MMTETRKSRGGRGWTGGERFERTLAVALCCAAAAGMRGCASGNDRHTGADKQAVIGVSAPKAALADTGQATKPTPLDSKLDSVEGGLFDAPPFGESGITLDFFNGTFALSNWQVQQTGTQVVSAGLPDLRMNNIFSPRDLSGNDLNVVAPRVEASDSKKSTDEHKTEHKAEPKELAPGVPAGGPRGGGGGNAPPSINPADAMPAGPAPEAKDKPNNQPAAEPKSDSEQKRKGSPDRSTWERPGADLPSSANRVRRDADAEKVLRVGASGPIADDSPKPDEELWIIAKLPPQGVRQFREIPTTGSLVAKPVAGGPEVALQIESTRVSGTVDGLAASLTFQQRFRNPLDTTADLLFAFPLPADAALTDFVMSVGSRKIRGVIRERDEAVRIFSEATKQGYRASLVLQERPSVFTQRLANVASGGVVETSLTYVQSLRASAGSFAIEMPTSTTGKRSPVADRHELAVDIHVTGRSQFSRVSSPTHAIDSSKQDDGGWTVNLRTTEDSAGNLLLRMTPTGGGLASRLFTERADDGTVFALTIIPPDEFSTAARRSADVLIVIDTGQRPDDLERSKLAAMIALSRLMPTDRVRVAAVGETLLGASAFTTATAETLKEASVFIQGLAASSKPGKLTGAITGQWPPGENLRIVMMLTGGGSDPEPELFAAARALPKGTRVLSMGLGTSVNRRVVDGLARISGGAAAYLGPGDEPADAIDPFLEMALRPALRDVWIDWGGGDVTDVYPRRMPDVLPGKPVVIYGRVRGHPPAAIVVHGMGGSGEATLRVDWATERAGSGPISTLWARQKVAQLAEDLVLDPLSTELRSSLVLLARRHNLVTPFTAFIAVDATEPVAIER